MRTLIALFLLSVTLNPPFGEAEARAVEVGADGMVLEVQVQIDESALVVLARGIGPVDELPPVALSELGPGRWGGIVELPIVEDILLGFEIIRPDGGSAIVSELNRLSDLGVDPAVFAVDDSGTTTSTNGGAGTGGGDDGPSPAPMWLALAAGAAALALLLVWWLGGNGRGDEDGVSAENGAEMNAASPQTSDADPGPDSDVE